MDNRRTRDDRDGQIAPLHFFANSIKGTLSHFWVGEKISLFNGITLEPLMALLGGNFLIAHDLAVVQHMINQIGVMYLGKLVKVADNKELYLNPLHPYTPGPSSVSVCRERWLTLRYS